VTQETRGFSQMTLSAALRSVHTDLVKRLTIHQVLVPIDFSELSIEAIPPAKKLARRFNANVHLVHVHWFDYPTGFTALPGPVPGWPITVHEHVGAGLAARLKEIARTFDLPPEHCHLRTGAPVFDEISYLAQELPADLIMTSTHGRGGLKRFFLGSTAERLVQHAPCPVVVSRKSRTTIDKILVPVDFSRCSLKGLKYAIQFADQFAARLFILNTVYLGEPYNSDGFAIYDLSVLEREQRENAEQQMLRFVRQAKFGRVKFKTVVKMGYPTDYIDTFAEKEKIDLIITSTHGRTGFKHALMGSTAEQVVRRAPCSVLVVPSHAEVRIGNLRASRGARREIRRGRSKPERIPSADLSKRPTKLTRRPFPERRKTNKFRESHLIS
jgi:nucleotide-binding universal stress UspA family protein